MGKNQVKQQKKGMHYFIPSFSSLFTIYFSLAFVLQTQFLTSDRAVENTSNLKRTHMLMPYRAIAQILKISNPFLMVKGVMDLFLAQPFGGKSLFQR